MGELIKQYILYNWILILILVAFVIVLATTVFLQKKSVRRLYVIIGVVFALSITVFLEYYYKDDINYRALRMVLTAIRYSATPFIIAQIIFALIKKARAFVFIPAVVLLILNIVSAIVGIVSDVTIVFNIDKATNELLRGEGALILIAYLPFVVVGIYCALLIYVLIKRSNKRFLEIIPIIFLVVAFLSGLVFPFIFESEYLKIFCPTIATALFVYYVFMIIQLTKKDALTGLLNRQAYYVETSKDFKDITAIISLDMNGLKKINDTYGHDAGDEALITLGLCFAKACKARQSAYRMGGDEFAIVCRKTNDEEVEKLIDRIKKYVSETKYTCSIGCSYQKEGFNDLDSLLKSSDEKMYLDKAEFYKTHSK